MQRKHEIGNKLGCGAYPQWKHFKKIPGVPKCKEHMKLKQMWVGGTYSPPPPKSKNNWIPKLSYCRNRDSRNHNSKCGMLVHMDKAGTGEMEIKVKTK